MEQEHAVCVACGSKRIHPGTVLGGGGGNVRFAPDVTSWLSYAPMLPTRAVVCMNCGFIASYLDEKALDKIRQQTR